VDSSSYERVWDTVLSVSIDDPSFAEKINCRLVKTGSEQGHTLYWERQRARD